MKSIQVFLYLTILGSPALADHDSRRYGNGPHPQPEALSLSHGINLFERMKAVRANARNFINKLPSCLFDRVTAMEDVLEKPQQYLEDIPADMATEAINQLCYTALLNGTQHPSYTPSSNDFKYYLMTENGNISIPWDHPELLANRLSGGHVTVFVTGFNHDSYMRHNIFRDLYEAYRCRGIKDFIVANVGEFLENFYAWAFLNAEKAGEYLGESLTQIAKRIPTEHFHLVGHSVGAHVSGAAARKFYQLTGEKLPRVTGLDPAKICYRVKGDISGLHRGDAELVDIIHSSSYGLGQSQPSGDVDFYPHGPGATPPGTNDLVSAHFQSIKYYIESVTPGQEENFLANECNSMERLRAGQCHIGKQVPMGYATPDNSKGNYFLEVNSEQPWGRNANPNQKVQCNQI